MRLRSWIAVFGMCWAGFVSAQQEFSGAPLSAPSEIPNQYFPSIQLVVKEKLSPQQVLEQVLPAMGLTYLSPSNFRLNSMRESPEGFHYLYTYQIRGIDAEDRYIRLFIDKSWVIRQVITSLQGVMLQAEGFFGDELVLRGRIQQYSFVGEISRIWKYEASGWQAFLKVNCIEDIAANAKFRYYNSNYQEVFQRDNALRFNGKDSIIQAKVFWPDPLTSSRHAYGDEYQDFNDADTPSLNNERVLRPIRVDFQNDTFFLRDSNLFFKEIETPSSDQPVRLIPDFNFTRSQQGFEFVNAFYHLQTWIDRVHALGYNLPNARIQVDPHAANGQDVSVFTPAFGELTLLFGEGGIDDAEDSDVLIHELSHALSYAAAPNTTNGLERTSMEEGTCDYFAMSYSRQISNYGWEKTFQWDGNWGAWQGRTVNTKMVLPQDFSSNKYENAEIWVAALREVYDNVGPDITDKLVLCALYNQVSNMKFYQMVNNCLQCDSIQNAGVNYTIIFDAMSKRGLAYPLGFSGPVIGNWRLLNSAGFAFRAENLTVDFGDELFSGSVELYDLQGKMIRSFRSDQITELQINGSEIVKGLYLLKINSDTNLSLTFKIARY